MKAVFKSAWPYREDAMNLPVENVEAAIPFYETVMGFRVVSRQDAPCKSAVLARDTIRIGLAENGGDLDGPHLANFIHCVRTREEPSASLLVARRAEQLCHLGVDAYREERVIAAEIGGAVRTASPLNRA